MRKISFKILPISILGVLISSLSLAQVCSSGSAKTWDIGFSMSKKQLQILSQSQELSRNVEDTDEQKLARVVKHIPQYRKEISKISNAELAKTIVKASSIVGVDFTMLSSVVRKESLYCKLRHNKTGGDSGCMQFTTSGLTELKHQFGLAGPKQTSPGVTGVLKIFVRLFFAGKSDQEANFYKWLSLPVEKQKKILREGSLIDADILSGALLLKIYLSVNHGNYIPALQQYNSSKNKIAYANDVNAVAKKINLDSRVCEADRIFADSIVTGSCELSSDEQCFRNEKSLMDTRFEQVIQNI